MWYPTQRLPNFSNSFRTRATRAWMRRIWSPATRTAHSRTPSANFYAHYPPPPFRFPPEVSLMTAWYPLLAVLAASLGCAYFRVSLRTWTIAGFAALFAIGILAGSHWLAIALTALAFGLIAVPL